MEGTTGTQGNGTHEPTVSVQLVNVEQMAAILNVPVSWLYQRTRRGEIPHVRVGKYIRFEPARVLAYLKSDGNEAK